MILRHLRVQNLRVRYVGVVVGTVFVAWAAPTAPASHAGALSVAAGDGHGTDQLKVVDAPISDGFRPPQCVWCPGNRGVEYASSPGQAVTAVRSGYVSFAGRVAGVGYVVVAMSDGLRITYGGVNPGHWQIGDPVRRGAVIALAEGPVHLGLRAGDYYLDPAMLAERRSVRARIVGELPGGR